MQRKVLDEFEAIAGVAPGSVDFACHEAWLVLGENDRVFEWMEPLLRNKSDYQWTYLHLRARFLPLWDALRGTPRFESLLRETKPESAKPFDELRAGPSTELRAGPSTRTHRQVDGEIAESR